MEKKLLYVICAVIFIFTNIPIFSQEMKRLNFSVFLQEKNEDENYIFSLPRSICFDSGFSCYVLDTLDASIKKYDLNGKYISKFGRKGNGPGEFRFPFHIQIVKDNLVVMDFGKVNIFSLNGAFIESYSLSNILQCDTIKFKDDLGFVCEEQVPFFGYSLTDCDRNGKGIAAISKLDLQEYFKNIKEGTSYSIMKDYMKRYLYAIGKGDKIFYVLADKMEVFKWERGKSAAVLSSDISRRQIPDSIKKSAAETVRNSKVPTIFPVADYFNTIQDLTVDFDGNIWIYLLEKESNYIFKYSDAGKILEKYLVNGINEMNYGERLYSVKNRIFIWQYDATNGLTIYQAVL